MVRKELPSSGRLTMGQTEHLPLLFCYKTATAIEWQYSDTAL